ncbi:tRNA (adenosine(37)-N6)-dimethylallyltransferase MiaA [Pleomorphovibrio marinus]|uniref:tRNA (adenosine(37)-N6)-dimethylallyltransferase MiaA n=1 Tax=Pleomorphovibrio marinus TaxID=2164132 RepID=UPI000E0C2479|nr:tRNA (adenosine(37)-N6)-dimethylallyltransferase MiaA [Pleomorphovibrio marinus]
MVNHKNILLVISGPTAVGKSDLCIKLAKKFNTSIISSDSRQFFKEMNIGTSKPSEEELAKVPHFFINSLSIFEGYDVRKFETDVINMLNWLFKMRRMVIMTGGSGLYIDAVTKGLDEIPAVEEVVREELNVLYRQEGIGVLQQKLSALDPEYYEKVDLQNPQRLIRALEVTIGTGKPYSSYRLEKRASRPFSVIKIGLERDREELYQRVNERMDAMIEMGLFEEAASLFHLRHLNALQTVGYKEIFDYMAGKYDKEEAIRLLKRNSRRYAKRQLTWLRRDGEYTWFRPDEEDIITSFIVDQMAE